MYRDLNFPCMTKWYLLWILFGLIPNNYEIPSSFLIAGQKLFKHSLGLNRPIRLKLDGVGPNRLFTRLESLASSCVLSVCLFGCVLKDNTVNIWQTKPSVFHSLITKMQLSPWPFIIEERI